MGSADSTGSSVGNDSTGRGSLGGFVDVDVDVGCLYVIPPESVEITPLARSLPLDRQVHPYTPIHTLAQPYIKA